MTLREFVKEYEGFDWENGEVAIFDQRRGTNRLCTVKNGELIWMCMPIMEDGELNTSKIVYDWTHSSKTMLIVI
jgi:hypothetical protein